MEKSQRTNRVFICGIVGIIGILITIISDFILLSRTSNGYAFFQLNTEIMADFAHWRITVGTFLGVIALPFQAAGLAPLYHVIKPAGKVLSLTVMIASAHAILMGVAFHVSYAFMGSAWKLYYEAGTKKEILSGLLERYESYWWIIIITAMSELIFSSILYVVILLKGKSYFPRWMALFNPVFIILMVFSIILILPAPIGGIVAPAVLNISTLIFVAITLLGYNKIKNS